MKPQVLESPDAYTRNLLKIVQVPIKDLKPAEYNPRQWSEKDIKDLTESVKRYGLVDPIIVNSAEGRKNIVIGGHFRLKVASGMGLKEVPVVYVNIPDIKREQELNLRLNRNVGQWDFDLLANFDENILLDVGFEQSELDNIFDLEVIDDFDVGKEIQKMLAGDKPRVKEGDIWSLGNHRLRIGNCVDKKNWESLLGKDRFDLMFTDPPYRLAYSKTRTYRVKTMEGMKLRRARTYLKVGETNRQDAPRESKNRGGFGCKQSRFYLGVQRAGGVPEFDEWLSIAKDFQNPVGANVMVFENWRNTVSLWQSIEKYWKIRNLVVWWLPNRSMGFSRDYTLFNKLDIALLADKGKAPDNPEMEDHFDRFLENDGSRLMEQHAVSIFANSGKSEWGLKPKGHAKIKGTRWAKVSDHVSWTADDARSGRRIIFGTKPVPILVPYIKIMSPRNGIVMEPFGGAGSTLIACEVMGRRCRVIEIEPIYAEVILRRWEKITGRKAEKIGEAH